VSSRPKRKDSMEYVVSSKEKVEDSIGRRA